MPGSGSRIVGLAALCALAGCFLLIVDLGEKPRLDRIALEVLLLAPLALWFVRRRLHLKR
ncbi:MAG: hypothetical protein ACJ8FS_06205 [Sphingomicrobium sp.]